jgi:tetratricopeptide (TPR) repeat protein
MEAGKYKEAIQQLQFAHDYDPQNSLYRAELAYCQYLFEPDMQAQSSLQALNETLRIDQDCGLAAYYSGIIHQELGNDIEAEAYLQKSIKMLAPDRRPIEALKVLKAGRKG